MASKITKVKYFTPEKKALISPANKKLYEKYLNSSIIKNRDVKETTYKTYENYFTQFLVFLAEKYDNIGLYSEEFFEDAVEIMESFISFCQETLKNNKKVINTKISSVSTFYLWSMKRKLVDRHPFDKQLERMKGASEEKIINSYFLNDEEVEIIKYGLNEEGSRFDIQDKIIWEVMLESANRIGAISKLTLSSLDIENMIFTDIREKRGYKVEVVFGEEGRDLIKQWLEMRKEMDNLAVDSLFITKYRNEYKPMDKGTIQERIKKIGAIIGLDDFHAHCIRKTQLNSVYEKTGDLSLAAELANHKSIETTRQSYIKPQSKAEVRDKINKMKEKMKREKEIAEKKESNNES
ncbi:integrase/recombinase XerC [Paenibacillus sophorae]|uniref:Integrase/recombinase XerC n=1 Tax=Paenibacillus sophorae TaxID=1333845 RepID=A0A1H8H5E3_9BACL|nr:tyrosine-type recombinase/integrase [Paenibacillus sophorae]QWU14444.1 site-specific integrase [Paenibacillus sophorae]SEN51230.1 integrase/recombinase XerC [Paenibacillus sophorae]